MKSVVCDIDVLWSFNGIFSEIVYRVERMSLIVAKFSAIEFDWLLDATGKVSDDNDEAEERQEMV